MYERSGIPYLLEQGSLCLGQFKESSNPEHIQDAIDFQNQALVLTDEVHPFRCSVLDALAQSFLTRFERSHDPEDIKKATLYSAKAVDMADVSQMAVALLALGNVYHHRFLAFRQLEDLELALSYKLQALGYAPPYAEYLPDLFNTLGLSLSFRFDRLKDVQDIDHSIMWQEQSLIGGVSAQGVPPLADELRNNP